MARACKSRQRGMSFIGLLFMGALLAATGVVIAQVIPTVIEYQAIVRAAKKAAEGASVIEVKNLFDKVASVDNISSVTGKDLEVAKDNDKVVVSFAYQREIHLFGPAFLTLKYTGKSN